MRNSIKAALAATTGAALLLGGAGSLAYWSDEEVIPGGTINGGSLDLTRGRLDHPGRRASSRGAGRTLRQLRLTELVWRPGSTGLNQNATQRTWTGRQPRSTGPTSQPWGAMGCSIASVPPSMNRQAPTMLVAWGPSRKQIGPATSSARPVRPIAVG